MTHSAPAVAHPRESRWSWTPRGPRSSRARCAFGGQASVTTILGGSLGASASTSPPPVSMSRADSTCGSLAARRFAYPHGGRSSDARPSSQPNPSPSGRLPSASATTDRRNARKPTSHGSGLGVARFRRHRNLAGLTTQASKPASTYAPPPGNGRLLNVARSRHRAWCRARWRWSIRSTSHSSAEVAEGHGGLCGKVGSDVLAAPGARVTCFQPTRSGGVVAPVLRGSSRYRLRRFGAGATAGVAQPEADPHLGTSVDHHRGHAQFVYRKMA